MKLTAQTCIRELLSSKIGWTIGSATRLLTFPYSSQINQETVLRLGHDSFLPNRFQSSSVCHIPIRSYIFLIVKAPLRNLREKNSDAKLLINCNFSRSVGIAKGFGLSHRGGGGVFPSLHSVKTCSGAHPTSYPKRIEDSFTGGWGSGGAILHLVPRLKILELYLHSPICPHG
jgi:hypothetical protein